MPDRPQWTSTPPAHPCICRIRHALFSPRTMVIYELHGHLWIQPEHEPYQRIKLDQVDRYVEWQYKKRPPGLWTKGPPRTPPLAGA